VFSDAAFRTGRDAQRPSVSSALKDKLGDWSNASSEVEFQGACAWLVGEEGRGIATILQMVALTRQDCPDRFVAPDAPGAGAGGASCPASPARSVAR
jgi:hypothetical protein